MATFGTLPYIRNMHFLLVSEVSVSVHALPRDECFCKVKLDHSCSSYQVMNTFSFVLT